MESQLKHLPLREPTFFILLSLTPGPNHGYAIIKEVESLSEGRLILSTGTLFGAIKRLLEDGCIKRVQDPLPDNGGRIRKTYALTGKGQAVLKAEIHRLQKLIHTAQSLAPKETGE
jgi:DNA-binding PadR family transcriptional regulator